MSTNGNQSFSQQFWDRMQEYWHSNRSFPPAHPDWRKKADLVDGQVPAAQLPSYVDDVLEFNAATELPQPGEKGKIYITTTDNKQFRWGGTAYVEIDNTQLGNYVPYEGAKHTVNLNGQHLEGVKHFYSHSGIQDHTLGLSVINDATFGTVKNPLIKIGAVPGNMITFTVKLYSYPYEFYEFQVNVYIYNNSYHEPTIHWKSGNTAGISKAEFYKDESKGLFYVRFLCNLEYPRIAITDLQGYAGDSTFRTENWDIQWGGEVSHLTLQNSVAGENFKTDPGIVTVARDQTISGNKTFTRGITFSGTASGITFGSGNALYEKAGSGMMLKKGMNNQNPRVENKEGDKSWEIIHEGNLQNIVSGNNGWGGNFNTVADPDVTHKSGFYGADPNSNLPENYYTSWINVNAWAEHDNYGFQIAAPLFGHNLYFRKFTSTGYDRHTHSQWWKFWTTQNFDPAAKADRENNAAGIGFDAGLIENPYMKHNGGVAHLATRSWTDAGFVPRTHPAAGISHARIDGWDNAVSQFSASEEIILEDDTLKILPDEFSLEGSNTYQIASKRSKVHVLFREGSDLNILKLIKRQTIVIFNFEKGPVTIIPAGLKPYSLPSQSQVTLYVSDTGDVLLYNESSFTIAD